MTTKENGRIISTWPPVTQTIGLTEWSPEAQFAMDFHDQGFPNGVDDLKEYRRLARKVQDEGPECVICRHRGLNVGRFAIGDPPMHIGCATDAAHQEDN